MCEDGASKTLFMFPCIRCGTYKNPELMIKVNLYDYPGIMLCKDCYKKLDSFMGKLYGGSEDEEK